MKKRLWEAPVGDLAPPDESDFEFIPDIGFRFIGDGRSVILSGILITKSGVQLDDRELFSYGCANQGFLDGIVGLDEQIYLSRRIFNQKDFRNYGSKYAYKFVTEATYDEFISKGSFLVSSLSRFRRLEGQGDPAGDRFEGKAYCAYSVADRQLAVSTISGFDAQIFSLAHDLKTAAEMKSKFGSVVLRIRLLPFTQALARLLGNESAEVRLVRYADLKMYRGRLPISDMVGFPPKLSPRLAKALRQRGRLPSIFAKPSRFETEREVRIAIGASSDVPDMTVVEDRALLKFVERIDL